VKTLPKSLVFLLIIIATVLISFAIGIWICTLQRSLKNESEYPWELHRKIGSVNIQCEQLLHTPSTSHFFVKTLDNGTTLIVASLDKRTGVVTAFALSASGRIATDSWYLKCQ